MQTINQRFEQRFGIKVTRLSTKMGERPDFAGGVMRSYGACRLDTLLKLQAALGCPLADLVEIIVPTWTDGPRDPAVDLRGGA